MAQKKKTARKRTTSRGAGARGATAKSESASIGARIRSSKVTDESARVVEHLHWDFSPEFVPLPGEKGMPESMESPESIAIESICGGVDDSQPVEQYDGTLGVTTTFVNTHQAPVGQLQWNDNLASIYTNPGNVAGVRWCSGALISNNLFLTAGHCFDQTGGGWQRPMVNGTTNIIPPAEIATNMHVNFNFQVDPAGNLRTEQSFAVTELVEYRLGSLDFAVCRLDGSPGATFGFTRVSATDAAEGDMLAIIGHPAGLPKRIEAGPAFHLHDDRIGYDSIDTLGGNSGSGILSSPNGRIIGVHTNGGCDNAAIGHNHGVRITSIIAASPTVAGVATTKLKFADEPGGGPLIKKAVDDPIPKPVLDPTTPVKKIVDDPIPKVVRDPSGPIKKLGDDPGPKFKPTDDPKMPGDVKRGAFDAPFDPRLVDPRVSPVARGPAPFVLATPHHAGVAGGNLPQEAVARLQQRMFELQQQMQQLNDQMMLLAQVSRSLTDEYAAIVAAMREYGAGL